MPSKKTIVSTSQKEVPVVTFANGTIKESRKRHLTVSALHDASHRGSGKRRKTVVVESKKMTYKGDNFGPLAAPEHNTQLYVAEVKKATGEMTMFPAEIFHLHPMTEVDLKRDQLELDSMSFREKNDLLTDAFGSRKQKKALQQRKKNKLAEGAVTSAMGSALDMALATHQSQPAPEPKEGTSAIPPFNKDAKSPADVYSIKDILGPVEMDSLTHVAEVIKNCTVETLKEWTEKKEYYSSVLTRLKVMPMGETQRQERACLLLYLHYMLTMFHYRSDQIRKRDPLPQEWPDSVKRLMLDRFTIRMEGNRRCCPARAKDLLLSHILVLCLTVDGFHTPLGDLLKDLKISVNRLHNHVRALGCRVKTESSNKDTPGVKIASSSAVLTVPLVFPEPPKKRNAKK
ncbi:DNA-directed RNA polymerase I subunit RPA49-like [Babylonia areolata]|uniref:DNA-directed RNA polymerase I subunit RPA49-like n=1 Tax=Babylonia areolata TaxID=304850 RepID=UPI003FD45F14